MKTPEMSISASTTDLEFGRLAVLWDKNNNVDLTIDEMTEDEISRVVEMLIARLPCSLYESVLETLAERNETPLDCLLKIFCTNIESCQMSVCLRDDLDNELKCRCMNSEHKDVCEHFKMRQKWLKSQ